MKLLLDSCVWRKATEPLRAAGHDVIHAGDWAPDTSDVQILTVAHVQGRVIVTFDKDFGTLVSGRAHSRRSVLRRAAANTKRLRRKRMHFLILER